MSFRFILGLLIGVVIGASVALAISQSGSAQDQIE